MSFEKTQTALKSNICFLRKNGNQLKYVDIIFETIATLLHFYIWSLKVPINVPEYLTNGNHVITILSQRIACYYEYNSVQYAKPYLYSTYLKY